MEDDSTMNDGGDREVRNGMWGVVLRRAPDEEPEGGVDEPRVGDAGAVFRGGSIPHRYKNTKWETGGSGQRTWTLPRPPLSPPWIQE